MSVVPEDTFDNFAAALSAKFPALLDDMIIWFNDEDGDMLAMQDDGDYEAAVDVARSVALIDILLSSTDTHTVGSTLKAGQRAGWRYGWNEGSSFSREASGLGIIPRLLPPQCRTFMDSPAMLMSRQSA